MAVKVTALVGCFLPYDFLQRVHKPVLVDSDREEASAVGYNAPVFGVFRHSRVAAGFKFELHLPHLPQ